MIQEASHLCYNFFIYESIHSYLDLMKFNFSEKMISSAQKCFLGIQFRQIILRTIDIQFNKFNILFTFLYSFTDTTLKS